jgi:hypothetical protein
MRRGSRSDARTYCTSRRPSWTYALRWQTCRGMLVRIGSRSSRCSEPSWTDCLQQQDLQHHHQPRDVFVTSWFIFHTPFALHCIFFIRTLWAVRDLSLGVFYHIVHILFCFMQFILIMVYFLCELNFMNT